MSLPQFLPPGSHRKLLPWLPLMMDYIYKPNETFPPQVAFGHCFYCPNGNTVIKTTYERKPLIGLHFQRIRIHDGRAKEQLRVTSWSTSTRQKEKERHRELNQSFEEAHPQWQTFSNKAAPPNPSQAVPPTGEKYSDIPSCGDRSHSNYHSHSVHHSSRKKTRTRGVILFFVR